MGVRLGYKYVSGIVKLNIFHIYIHFIFIDTNLKSYILDQFKGSTEVNSNEITLQLFWNNSC